MMQKLLSLLLATLLLCGATGCSGAASRSAGDSDIIGDAVLPKDAGDPLFGGNDTDQPDNSARSYDTLNPANGSAQRDGASSYEEMLQNGRVHDTDGILTDRENAQW